MDDDFNTSVLIAELFEATKTINSIYDGKTKIDQTSLENFKKLMKAFVMDVLGLKNDLQATDDLAPVMDFILKIRTEAKANKDYATSDKIRIGLNEIGFQVKDGKEGSSWAKE
jgi:cysteinyl-tRNA synthetase